MQAQQRETSLPERFVPMHAECTEDAVQAYRAYDRHLRCNVLVETLGFGDFRDWNTFDRFERRCQLLSRLHHTSLPQYLTHGQDADTGRFFLATVPAEGHLLEATRDAGRRYEEVALRAIAWQLVELLEYVHGQHQPVILLDITPSNLVLRKDGRLVLRRLLHARPVQELGSDFDLELPFAAPEVLEGRPVLASDVYALGATLAVLAGATGISLEDELESVLPDGAMRRLITLMVDPDPCVRPSLRQIRQALRGGTTALAVRAPYRAPARRPAPTSALQLLRKEALPLARTLESGAVIGCAGAALGVSLQELCVQFLAAPRGLPEAYLVVTLGTVLLGMTFMLGANYGSRVVRALALRVLGEREGSMRMLGAGPS